MNNWREKVDSNLRKYLERVIYETSKHKDSYKLASKPDNAQLWVAVANLSRQIVSLNSKLSYLENIVIEVTKRKKEFSNDKKSISRTKNIKKSKKKKSRKLEKSLKRY